MHTLDWQTLTTKKATSKSKADTITAMLAAAAAAAAIEFGRERVLENRDAGSCICMHARLVWYVLYATAGPGGGWCSSISDRSSYSYLDFLESLNPTYLLSIMRPSFIIIFKIALQFNHCQLPSLLLFVEIVIKNLEFRMRMKNVTPCNWQ